MEKVIEIAKNVAIVILALIVAFILFIGLGKLASFAFSSLASAGASLTSVFVPATSTPVIVGPGYAPQPSAGGTYSTSSATMTVQQPQPAQTTTAYPATTYTAPVRTVYVAPVVSYYGLPDLAATVVSTGIVNSAGVFIPQAVVYEGQRAAAQILVTNVGTNVSGQWILQAPLPTNEGGEVFTSYPQASLTPGSSAKLTLAFNDLRDVSVSSMVVTVDPYNQIPESNKSNNQVVVTFQKSVSYGYNTGYNSGYTYPVTTYTNVNQQGSGNVYYSNGSYYTYPTNNSYNTYPYNYNNASYLPDLTVSITGVTNSQNTYYTSNSTYTTNTCTYNTYGYWNGYTGSSCTNNGNPNFYDQQRTVQIQVTNIGQSTASNYNFTASVNGTNEYTSPTEPSLAPGQSASYSFTLNDVYSGTSNVTVTVNPYNSVQESNYSNNTATQSF